MQISPIMLTAIWQKKTMTTPEAFAYSGMALLIVFFVLAILAVVILIFSKAFRHNGKKEAAKPAAAQAASAAPAPPAAGGLTQDEIQAISLSAICDDLGVKPEEIAIRSFREIQ